MLRPDRLDAARRLVPAPRPRGLALAVLPWVLAAGVAEAAVVPAELVARSGDVPMGTALPVDSTLAPFVLADGSVAFVGLLEGGEAYVFIGDQVVWQSGDEVMMTLMGAEPQMGATIDGAFIYAPTIDGDQVVWTHQGLLAREGEQAPVFPPGVVSTFHSRPLMVASGAVYWLAGINTAGGASTEQRVVYRSPTGLPEDIELVIATGDVVGDLTISAPAGIDVDFDVSADGSHRIHVLELDTGSGADDGHIYVDGALLHQENTPNGSGDDWDSFDLVTINNQGRYVMSGDTDGNTGSDEFVAVDGIIGVREGDEVAMIPLTTPASVRAISVNEAGRVIHAWTYAGGTETVFYGCDAGDLAATSLAVLTTGVDELDLDGDGVGDATVVDLAANTLSSDDALTEDGYVYLDVDLDDGTGEREAMVRIPVTCCGNAIVDDDEQCDDGNTDDTDLCPGSCTNAVCGDGFVLAGVEECDDGNPADTDACTSACVAAVCGDGLLWAGVEECDDGNDNDNDQCPSGCMVAECGDGFVLAGVEECDDGNDDDTDMCRSDCTSTTCGDGIVQAGEGCDDRNEDDSDACPTNCQPARCGDGYVQAGVEECDDANDDDEDGCASDCTLTGSADSTGDSSGDTSGGEPPGTTGGETALDSGDVTGVDEVTSSPAGSSGGSSSTGTTGVGTFGGLDDDGGCTCRADASRGLAGRGAPLALLLLLGRRRRRRSGR